MNNTQLAINQIQKQFGQGSIIRLGDKPPEDIKVFSSGSILLDKALGVGGIPEGRVIEIFGPESSGKTTLALHMLAEAQKAGKTVAFIDAEHALDLKYAKNLGVDIENLLVSQPDCGDDAMEIIDILIRSNEIGAIVIDSVAALTPRAEIEGDMGQAHMGLQARLMSQALRKITAVTSKANCSVIFINQLRQNIGVTYGNPETTTGGNALKFYASIRIDIRRIEKLKDKLNNIVANRVKIKVVKNKVAPPFREIETTIIFGVGIDRNAEILELAIVDGIVEQAGAWYKYKNEKIQGRENMLAFVSKNEEFQSELKEKKII